MSTFTDSDEIIEEMPLVMLVMLVLTLFLHGFFRDTVEKSRQASACVSPMAETSVWAPDDRHLDAAQGPTACTTGYATPWPR